MCAWILFAVALASEGRVHWIGWKSVLVLGLVLVIASVGYVASAVHATRHERRIP